MGVLPNEYDFLTRERNAALRHLTDAAYQQVAHIIQQPGLLESFCSDLGSIANSEDQIKALSELGEDELSTLITFALYGTCKACKEYQLQKLQEST